MRLLGRPNAPGISREKLGVVGAVSAILAFVTTKWLGLELDKDVLFALATLLLAAVQWRARNRRAEEDRPLRAAKMR
jgi:hypothetical protein